MVSTSIGSCPWPPIWRHPSGHAALYLLTLADRELEPPIRSRLDDLYELLQGVLARPELAGRDARNILERARAEAQRLAPDAAARERLDAAPRAWLLAHPPSELARQAALADPPPRTGRYRVAVRDDRIDVVTGDRRGVLAAVANVLSTAGLTIGRASTATWPDGAVVMSFDVDGEPPPAEALAERLSRATFVWGTHPVDGARISFDDHASPWHTIVDVPRPTARDSWPPSPRPSPEPACRSTRSRPAPSTAKRATGSRSPIATAPS